MVAFTIGTHYQKTELENGIKRQMACKPGSVPHCWGDGHSSGMCIAAHLTRPTRTAIRKRIICRPYLVLLPVGLAMPSLLPKTRCALTAPFQPCRTF